MGRISLEELNNCTEELNKCLKAQISVKQNFVSGPRARHKIPFIRDSHLIFFFNFQCNPSYQFVPQNTFYLIMLAKTNIFEQIK